MPKNKSRTELSRTSSGGLNRRQQSRGSLLREASRGRVGADEKGHNSERLSSRQSEDYSQARLIYRANSDLTRRFQAQNSPQASSSTRSVSNIKEERLARLDSYSHIPQRAVSRDHSRQQLSRESSTLKTSNSRYKLIRDPSIVKLQRDNSRGGFLARANSSSLLQRQSSSSQLPTLTRAKSRGQVVTELCTRSVSPQSSGKKYFF